MILFPRSAGVRRYVEEVAPEILTPSRFHTYAKAAAGDQVPGTAVNVEPTVNEPEIVGVGAVVNGVRTAAVATLALDTDVYPALTPVTVTVNV